MIYGIQHPGSGVGDMLFCYLAARITAERLGVPFTMVGKSKYDAFITVDKGVEMEVPHHIEYPAGKLVIDLPLSIYEGKTYYDPEFNFIEDNTIVDGCRIQDERYFENYPIGEWLKSEPLNIPPDTGVINFRGGEFQVIPELFLSEDYWRRAIATMQKKHGYIHSYEIHTDDPAAAERMFGKMKLGPIIHNVGINWRSVRSAHHAIIANSAFGIIPRLLAKGTTIAPRYWARPYSTEWTHQPQNYYKDFIYV